VSLGLVGALDQGVVFGLAIAVDSSSDSASEDSSGSVAAGSSSALSGLSSSSELSSASELSSSSSSWFSCVLSPFPALRQLAGKPEDLGRLPGFELLWCGAV
jgi:hypothetical protein